MMNRIGFALALTAACSAGVDDEFATDDATEGDASKADAPGGTFTYYFLKPDLRLCLSPICGGVFYSLANGSQTTCLDGHKADQCYAASVDWTKLGLGDTGMAKVNSAPQVLVRATVAPKQWSTIGTFAELRPTEAWLSQGPNEATGPIVKIEDSGIRCITAPCPSLRERKLNSVLKADLAELGWDESGASERLIGTAMERLYKDGLIVAGYRYMLGGGYKARTVTQFWFRATDDAAPTQCYVGGCSGQICSDQEGAISTCEWRPEYACYHSATCEVQTDGTCGWTQTPELQACLADPPN